MMGADSPLKAGGVSSATVAPHAIPCTAVVFHMSSGPKARGAWRARYSLGGTTHREETPMKTVVKCSLPDCDDYAVMKVAAPWKDGSHAELNTYGYACPAHVGDVVAHAEGRAKAYRLAPGESVGKIGTVPLANA